MSAASSDPAAVANPAIGPLFTEDEHLLSFWREEMEARLEERATLRARHRDQLEDALDHLEGLRQAARDRTIDASVNGASVATAEKFVPPPPKLPDPFTSDEMAAYQFAPLDLLRPPAPNERAFSSPDELDTDKRRLQDALDSFAVDALVHDAIVGPRITQFRVRPGFGVRVEAIASLEKNIALSMAANAVRIQAPIPGENFVGIEIPNRNSVPLTLRGSFESADWCNTSAEIPLILGVDIAGRHVLCDLARAPHALIAGATGSGKSVCISNLILSLVYRFRPDELELMLIDPKIVEFAIYRDLPHLIHPVVTEPKQAVQALKWLVREMERRYEILAEKGDRKSVV